MWTYTDVLGAVLGIEHSLIADWTSTLLTELYP